jgi:hypothetical protein
MKIRRKKIESKARNTEICGKSSKKNLVINGIKSSRKIKEN